MAPLVLAAMKFIGQAVASAAAAKAVDSAVPKKGIVPVGQAPESNVNSMDLQQLISGQQQHQPQLPQQSLQLQNRLPRPY